MISRGVFATWWLGDRVSKGTSKQTPCFKFLFWSLLHTGQNAPEKTLHWGGKMSSTFKRREEKKCSACLWSHLVFEWAGQGECGVPVLKSVFIPMDFVSGRIIHTVWLVSQLDDLHVSVAFSSIVYIPKFCNVFRLVDVNLYSLCTKL